MSATREEIEAAIRSDKFSHARQGDGCWRNVTWVYHYDENSPTGFVLAVGGDSTMVDALIRQYRATSALSPTELR